MDANGLKAHIKSNTIPNIMYFTGNEWEVQKIFIAQIAKVKKLETKRVESIVDVMGRLKSKSFVQKDYLYIARDDSLYMNDEKAQALLPTVIGQNMYIMLLTNVDKRTKFYKSSKDDIVEFEALPEKMLIKYIQKEIPSLSDNNCRKLIEVCESDYGRILLEIDKIKRYDNLDSREKSGSADPAFEVLLKDGTIYTPPKDAIFDFVDAILDRNAKCFDLYEQCKAVGEATLVMISVLYNNAKALLQVQSCESKDISKTTGLTGFQIMNAKKHLGKYKNGELVYLMKKCIECEQGIKTGKVEEQFAVEYILVSVL